MNRETFAKAVLDLALEINGGAVRRNGKGHPTAFCYYSGHINRIDVDVHPTGWVAEDEPDRFYFNLDKDSDNKLLDEYHRMSVYAVKLWRRRSMIKVTLKQGYNDIELEYDTIESVEELIRVVGSGQEIENLTIFIALEKPKEEED